MKRAALIFVVLLAAATGCSKKSPSAGESPNATPSATAAASASANPSASPSPQIHFTVDGAGPYQLGLKLADLQTAGQLDEVKTGGETCAANTFARGKGVWKDIRLSFRPDGTLYLVTNRSTTIPTPSGAWLGTNLAGLQSIYPAIGEDLTKGTFYAYLVTTGTGRGILFDLDGAKKTIAMVAGEASYLKSSWQTGTDFC